MPSPRTSRSARVLPAVALALVSLTTSISSAAAETPPVLAARPIVAADKSAAALPGAVPATKSESATATAGDASPRSPVNAARRPAALVPLYVSYAVLNGLDGHSTIRAIDAGASEANPFMAPFAHHAAAMAAAKAGMVAATIVGVERLRKKHPVAAVVFMAAATALYAVVAAHNYRLAHRLRR